MRKLSTLFSVYAILLTAVFYGTTSIPQQTGKTAQVAAVIRQKVVTSAGVNRPTACPGFYPGKKDNLKSCYSVVLQVNAVTYALVATGPKSFNHSAILQYYINTL